MNVGAFHSEGTRQIVRAMWIDGASQREIGRTIGKGKNVVAGLVKRMGLPVRRTTPSGWTAHKIAKARPKPAPGPEPIGPVGAFPDGDTCRFIASDPSVLFQCCGHKGFPYCEHHRTVVYQPRKIEATDEAA